jgi:hypothetical protein
VRGAAGWHGGGKSRSPLGWPRIPAASARTRNRKQIHGGQYRESLTLCDSGNASLAAVSGQILMAAKAILCPQAT